MSIDESFTTKEVATHRNGIPLRTPQMTIKPNQLKHRDTIRPAKRRLRTPTLTPKSNELK